MRENLAISFAFGVVLCWLMLAFMGFAALVNQVLR